MTNTPQDVKTSRCPGCGVLLPETDGPVHAYIESSPACWAIYGEVLARQYSDPALMVMNRLTVDAYAVQHPGRPSRQSMQSVGVHLVSLQLMLELNVSPEEATHAIDRLITSTTFTWLEPPASKGELSVADVYQTTSTQQHVERVRVWARSAWEAWSAHHRQVRSWGPPV